ncbi:hypothetical protein BDV41DRAFT_585895 [Aspergillus transmontanensis]|uniref:chitinase n=1 Tax=Aspergillus transmontanensis TaxID=1034304 RepID=A0A5N6VCY3_9EURO|nr:hypothetical protein BDV41DRAFT_585895 [Aspergillus transmontanensis]
MPSPFFFLALSLSLTHSVQVAADPSFDAWSQVWKPCPRDCSEIPSPAEWAVYSSVDQLTTCNQTLRLDFSLYNPSNPAIRACSASQSYPAAKASQVQAVVSSGFTDQEVTLQIGWWNTSASLKSAGVKSALEHVQKALLASENETPATVYSYHGKSLIGVYAGPGVQHSDAATTVFQEFTDHIESQDLVGRIALQYCGENSNKAIGIVVDASGDLAAVQRIVRGWVDGECQTDFDGVKELSQSILQLQDDATSARVSESSSRGVAGEGRLHSHQGGAHSHQQRAICRTIKVVPGDSCGALAERCGLSPADFTKFNPDKKLCSSLQPEQHVCCSAGTLPDLRPKPNEDGTCASYVVKTDESCHRLAVANGLKQEDLERFNKKTWGWSGCNRIQSQQTICLSEGTAPMPSIVDNAVCGPQVPGTTRPKDMNDLEGLNPCPLNACCDVWGQCGITDEFCTESKSSTGAPGTAAPNTNGCISNCGTDIVNNNKGPDEFISIGYFEAWNAERGCLNMDVTSFDTAVHTHLHFAFAEITESYEVDVSMVHSQFNKLKNMGSINRILTFGGWSFSTRADSFPIFRKGVSAENREVFATNVANFIVENDLEGVDFDWEYPGAPDIPGIPPGDRDDGTRYLEFLKMVREKLPSDKSVAIAAPASFWYLKGFPIEEISKVVDYIVFMAYDLHGQWDYGNKNSMPGCPSGDCLRSHVNLTETNTALSMVTKAGVPSSKIIVGVSSYGRSFKMTEPGCSDPMCKYVGPESAAKPGKCTTTAGYISDAEINRILEENPTTKKTYDVSSDSSILVYDSTEWVAYMDTEIKRTRTEHYRQLNMGGISDWAVDLQSFANSPRGGNNSPENQTVVYVDSSIWTEENPEVTCPAPCALVLPNYPLSSTTVITPPPHVTTLDVAWPTQTLITRSNGEVITTTTVTRILQETTIIAPPVTATDLPMANVNITIPLDEDERLTIKPKPRFPPVIVTITNDPNPLSQTGVSHPPVTRSVTVPPWPQTTVIYIPPKENTDDEDNNTDRDDKDKDNNDNNDKDNNDKDNNDKGSNDKDNNDKDNNDKDNNDKDNNGSHHRIRFPRIPTITVRHGPGSPVCRGKNCGHLCSDSFCGCKHGCGGGDNGFSDPNDPNPPPIPRPPQDPKDKDSCTSSSVTNYWVSCDSKTEGPTTTSCTTTKSLVAVGCDVTATTTTTGVEYCPTVDPNDPQGEDGGAHKAKRTNTSKTKQPPKPTSSPKQPSSTSSETTTSTKSSKTSSLPSATAASGCSKVGKGPSMSSRKCWNKCDPGTGLPVGGDWAKNDPWCWIAESGSDSYANCLKQSDCPTDFECAESWGCVVPLSGGCAPQGGKTGLGKTCWSSCNEKTGKRTNDEWEKGMPWCWLQNGRFASCKEDDDCSATTECVPDHWNHGGCNTKSKAWELDEGI